MITKIPAVTMYECDLCGDTSEDKSSFVSITTERTDRFTGVSYDVWMCPDDGRPVTEVCVVCWDRLMDKING